MWLIHRTRCKKSNLSPWFPSLFSELPFWHSFVVYIFPYLSISIMKAHLLLLFLQASLPNSLLDTAQILFHKLLKAFRQKAKLGGMLLGWAALLVLTALFPKCQDVTVFALPSIFHGSLPVPPSTWLMHCNLSSQNQFLSESAGTRSVAPDCLLLIAGKKFVTCLSLRGKLLSLLQLLTVSAIRGCKAEIM